ncbi:hypothetical protein BDA99DRAFT_492340 [Phascolomyces articulosus]|uniref:Uncharacterized protein n=1 Tax=Phascolomyces articulosus TaxID=60185 RepID=A0AAD5KRG8_9FUNG|nr:hypothetical protein BDA99DRAFT_492340 [Phascolomyces articulosus]
MCPLFNSDKPFVSRYSAVHAWMRCANRSPRFQCSCSVVQILAFYHLRSTVSKIMMKCSKTCPLQRTSIGCFNVWISVFFQYRGSIFHDFDLFNFLFLFVLLLVGLFVSKTSHQSVDNFLILLLVFLCFFESVELFPSYFLSRPVLSAPCVHVIKEEVLVFTVVKLCCIVFNSSPLILSFIFVPSISSSSSLL